MAGLQYDLGEKFHMGEKHVVAARARQARKTRMAPEKATLLEEMIDSPDPLPSISLFVLGPNSTVYYLAKSIELIVLLNEKLSCGFKLELKQNELGPCLDCELELRQAATAEVTPRGTKAQKRKPPMRS